MLIQDAYNRAESILTEHRDQLDALAALLIEREKLDRDEFELFMSGKSLPEGRSSVEPAAPKTETSADDGSSNQN